MTAPGAVVWVQVGQNRARQYVYHTAQECKVRRAPGFQPHPRVPTIRAAAEQAGIQPCGACGPKR